MKDGCKLKPSSVLRDCSVATLKESAKMCSTRIPLVTNFSSQTSVRRNSLRVTQIDYSSYVIFSALGNNISLCLSACLAPSVCTYACVLCVCILSLSLSKPHTQILSLDIHIGVYGYGYGDASSIQLLSLLSLKF